MRRVARSIWTRAKTAKEADDTPSRFSSPSTPAPPPPPYLETSATPRWILIAFVVAFLLVGYLAYASVTEHQALQKSIDDSSKRADALNSSIEKANAQFADLKGEMDVMSQKLGLTQQVGTCTRSGTRGAEGTEGQQHQIGYADRTSPDGYGDQVRRSVDRVKRHQERRGRDEADLEATKAKLQSTVGDMGVRAA